MCLWIKQDSSWRNGSICQQCERNGFESSFEIEYSSKLWTSISIISLEFKDFC